MKRRGEEELAAAQAAGGTHEFDVNKPFDWCSKAAAQDATFWKEELEDIAIQVVSKPRSSGSVLEHAPHARVVIF